MKNQTRINQLLTVLLLLCVLFVCMAGTVMAEDDCAHVFADGKCTACGVTGGYCGAETNEGGAESVWWTLTDSNSVLTIGGTGAMADYGSHTDRPWYDACTTITSLSIEEGVTRIGENAFYYCIKIESVIIPASVESLGIRAFAISSPKSVTFAEGSKLTVIGESAFRSCLGLIRITIPAGVTTIGESTFYNNAKLTELTLPSSVTSIGEGMCNRCNALTTVNVPCSWDGSLYTFGSGVTVNVAEHTPDENGYTVSDGTHSLTCTVCGSITEPHTYDDEVGTCVCGAVKTYTITFNPYGDSGVKIVEINSEAKEILHGGTFTAPHGKKLTVKFENTLSTQETGMQVGAGIGYFTYDEATNIMTILANNVNQDFYISADAYVRVQFNLHGGALTDEWKEVFEEGHGADTSTLKAKYGYRTGVLSEFFQLDGHTFAGAQVNGSDEVVQSLSIRSDMTVDILWNCDGSTLTPVPAKAATCMEAGNIAHYICTCGKLYAEDKTTVLTSVTLPVDPDNHVGMDSTTGKCACGEMLAVASVTVGSEVTYYKTLQEAMDAANEKTATVKLLTEVTHAYSITFYSPSNVTLDMNGQTLTMKAQMVVYPDASLTITGNGTYNKGGNNNAAFKVHGGGTLTIVNGTFEAIPDGCYVFDSSGTLNIQGGTFIADADYNSRPLVLNANSVTTVSGTPVFVGPADYTAMNGNTHYGTEISMNKAAAKLDLSAVTGSMDGWRVRNNDSTNDVTVGQSLILPASGYALKVGDKLVTTLAPGEIGTIVAHTHNYTTEDYDATHHWDECACGATTEKVNHTFTYTPVTGKEVHIVGCSGCTYTAPEEIPHEFTNGVCVCTAKAVAKVGETYYTDFANAVAAWTDGTTLTLLADVTYDNSIDFYGGSYTFVGGNYTLDLGIDAISIYNGTLNKGALTIESGTIKTTEGGPLYVHHKASAKINSDNTTLIGSDRQIAVDGSNSLTITGNGCDGWRIFAGPFNGNVPVTIPDGFHLEDKDGNQLDANDTLPAGKNTVIKTNHIHSWSYTADDEKDTITATCSGTIGTCPSAEQSITLNAPDAVYSGNPVEAEVTREGLDLTYTLHYTGTDYDSPDAPINAGSYTVTMTVGDKSVSASFTISPKDISVVQSVQFSLAQTSFVYSGEAPALNVTGVDSSVGNYTMQEGTDYSVGTVQVNAGSHKVIITGQGNYTGSVELDYEITRAPIDPAVIVAEDQVYTGEALEPAFTVTLDGKTLKHNVDFTYNWTNNVNVGEGKIVINGIGNYEGQAEGTFAIAMADAVLSVQTDKDLYTYGETVTVTASRAAKPATFALRSAIAPDQMALFLGDTQIGEAVDAVDGTYTMTVNTADKELSIGENTLRVVYVSGGNLKDAEATVTVALTAKSIEPVLSGSASKVYDGTTTVTDAGNLMISLNGIIAGDTVSATAAGYAYADETVGQSKTVTANGITLSGADSIFYTLAQTEASAQIGEIKKAMLIGLTEPADTTLDVYCADADAVIGKLPDTVVYHLADGKTVDLKVEWSCTAYDSTPGATNTFAWAINDSEKLACYEIAQNVADDGTVIVTNSAFLPVTVTGTDTAITYNGTAYDVTQMFAIDSNAGAAVFEIINGGTGEGTLNGSVLTITKAGTITIKVTTAPNASYAAGEATAVLTISKGTPAVTLPTDLTAWYGQKLSDIVLPTVDGGAWSWTDMNSTVGNSGVQTHQAIFTPADTNLWNITTHPVNITVAQAGTSFGEMKVYNGDTETTTFTYGETITVKATATAVQPAAFSLRSLIAPAKHQMALFIRNADGSEIQISEAVNEQNGVYTMTYNTAGKALKIGDNALIAKFVGDENMADYQETVLVTLNPKELGIASLTAQDRVYEPGNQQVAITGTEVSGKADANDDVSVLIDGMTATISSENVGTYDTALIPQDVSLTGNHAGYYFARGNVSVSIPQGVEITQATPYTASGAPAQPVFDLIYQDGQTLGDIPVSLPAGTFNVPGTIEWEAPGDTPVTEGTPFTWVFTPDDPNWKPVTGSVVIYPDGEPPVITAPAGDQEVTVYEGEQGTMFITAADASSYQWYINRYDGLGYVPISGATSASYTTSVVNIGNDGFTYYCVASNAYGNAESPVFLLQVLEKIEVPETGDESNIALWAALAILSFAGLTIITMNGRRSKITR